MLLFHSQSVFHLLRGLQISSDYICHIAQVVSATNVLPHLKNVGGKKLVVVFCADYGYLKHLQRFYGCVIAAFNCHCTWI